MIDVYYFHYWNVPTGLPGIVVFEKKEEVEKYKKSMSKWSDQNIYIWLEISGPHKHKKY